MNIEPKIYESHASGEPLEQPMRKRRWLMILAALFGIPLILMLTAWGALVIEFLGPSTTVLRRALEVLWLILGLAAAGSFIFRRWMKWILGSYLLCFVLILFGFWSVKPSNDRAWQRDVEMLPSATINGDSVTIHNIRNFDYRTADDYTPAYYDKTFNVQELDSVDLIAVYWMGPAIAHIFVSFGFQSGAHLAVSIETRKEVGEGYSTLKGFFRQYELFYVVADERDVIRLRTNYRHDPDEDVYIYRLTAPIENARRFFLDYIKKINSLKDTPDWYNTLTTNCTTNIWAHSRINQGHVPISWKILLSGYTPDYLYEQGRLDRSVPLTELRERGHANARAHEADQAPDFSKRIRAEAR